MAITLMWFNWSRTYCSWIMAFIYLLDWYIYNYIAVERCSCSTNTTAISVANVNAIPLNMDSPTSNVYTMVDVSPLTFFGCTWFDETWCWFDLPEVFARPNDTWDWKKTWNRIIWMHLTLLVAIEHKYIKCAYRPTILVDMQINRFYYSSNKTCIIIISIPQFRFVISICASQRSQNMLFEHCMY